MLTSLNVTGIFVLDQDEALDFGLRDPFGNHLRIVQLASTSAQTPTPA